MNAVKGKANKKGQAKFFFRLSMLVFRHGINVPTAIKKSRAYPIGAVTVLKKGACIESLVPLTASARSGKVVPSKTVKAI